MKITKKYLYTWFILCMCCISIVSGCTQEDDTRRPIDTKANKVVMFYLPWTGSAYDSRFSLYNYFLQNIEDIKSAIAEQGGMGNNRLLVFLCSSSDKADLFEVAYHNGEVVTDHIKEIIYNNGPDYTYANGLAKIFTEIKAYAPANKYSLIIGSHGMGWLPVEKTQKRLPTRYFGGSSKEFQMNITDLAKAIELTKIKMQYILFDDCYLSTIENAYDLRNATQYLIACTSEIMAYGMPYHLLWKDLVKDEPDYQQIVESFYQFYLNYTDQWGNPRPHGAIGVTKCDEVDAMVQLMKKINAQYTFSADKLSSIQSLDGFRKPIFYDMSSYVKLLCTDSHLYKEFDEQMQKMVPYKRCTPYIYTALGDLDIPEVLVKEYCGITISDPTESSFQNAYQTKMNTGWWIATH